MAESKELKGDGGGDESIVEPTGTMSGLAALYQDYPDKFSGKYFVNKRLPTPQDDPAIVQTVQRLISRNFTRENVRWGYYQKFASPNLGNAGDWGNDETYYKNWESSVDEAREALAKLPIDPKRPGPDPDSPDVRAKNMLEHLDTAVRIALFDKHLAGYPDKPGVEIDVTVRPQGKKSRRHLVTTEWRIAAGNKGDPKYKHDRLSISMTCPAGGWIGTAAWKYSGAAKFTRFVARLKVPDHDPKYEGTQILFIFNGLESVPPARAPGVSPDPNLPPAILQPVLQWTKSDGWVIRSWYVPATYTPSMDQMPPLGKDQRFATPASPAWTKGTKVKGDAILHGIIEWSGSTYHCWFEIGADKTKVEELSTPNILPLTYPVAVIEAYGWDRDEALVKKVKMKEIWLERSDAPPGQSVEPSWTLGTDDPPEPKVGEPKTIQYGTGRLQRYTVTWDSSTATLAFKRKPSKKSSKSRS